MEQNEGQARYEADKAAGAEAEQRASDDAATQADLAAKEQAEHEQDVVLDAYLAEHKDVAVLKVSPAKDVRVGLLKGEIDSARAAADRYVVDSYDAVKVATNDLALIGKLKKALTELRRSYVDPLNAWVKGVNESFKVLSDPLDEADKIVRGKVTAFDQEQKRRAAEAEAINRQKDELARREAALNQGVFTVDTTPVVVPSVIKVTRTDLGSSSMVESWKVEIVDVDLIPREYMMPDMPILNAIAKKYHNEKKVDGVRFYNEPGLRVSLK